VTIGEKREVKILKTPGPADYKSESALKHMKPNSSIADFAKSPRRKDNFVNNTSAPGPGFVEEHRSFLNSLNSKQITIGKRNQEKISKTIGPGHYSPEKSTKTVKNSNRAVDFAKSPTRLNKFSGSTQGADSSFLTNYFS